MSRTFLIRMEARSTAGDLAPGLAAQIGDPLWLLGRQWQFGELLGEDTGSPVSVEMAAESAQLSRFLHPKQTAPYDPVEMPLDTLTGDPIRSQKHWTARLRVDGGREFMQALAEGGVGDYADAYRAVPNYEIEPSDAELQSIDPAGARLVDVAAGRVPDGQKMYADIAAAVRDGTDLPETPAIDTDDMDAVRSAAEKWIAWCDETLADTGPSTWDDERLAHRFGVATGTGAGATTLDAEDFGGSAPDWHSFDVRPNAAPTGFKALPRTTTLPTGIRFRGMPNPRWWELEDASVDIGSIDAGPGDLARMAMLEFALVYGNDFFAVPLRLAVGSLTRIKSLVVSDTFGMRLRIRSAAESSPGADRWSMFTLTERDPGTSDVDISDLLFLAPVAAQLITSEPVEDVRLLRDEMANLAWAVESSCEGERGTAVERMEEHTRALPDLAAPDQDGTLRYRVGTEVPSHWFPLIPQVTGGEPRLRLERMANQSPSLVPRGRFLSFGGPEIPDAEVPREGTRLVRDYALARSPAGTSLAWARRVRRTGRGEGSSGLRFDVADLDRRETSP